MARDHNPFINAEAARFAVQHYQEKWDLAVEKARAEEGKRFWLVDKQGNHRDFGISYVMEFA